LLPLLTENAAGTCSNLQTRYGLEIAEDELAGKVERDVRPLETVASR
jgi:hypothetical protein